jgi:hypothetical protein
VESNDFDTIICEKCVPLMHNESPLENQINLNNKRESKYQSCTTVRCSLCSIHYCIMISKHDNLISTLNMRNDQYLKHEK